MGQRRLMAVFAFAVAVLFSLAACAPITPTPEMQSGVTPAAPTTGFPLTIVDDLGREVTLSAAPDRVVSIMPSNTEILFAVGASNLVVGVTDFCNYPSEVEDLPSVGGLTAKTISIETVVAMEPDLVLAGGGIQKPVVEALQELGLTIVALNPLTFEGVENSIETVGLLTGNQAQAEEVVASMQERLDAVTAIVDQVPEADRFTVYWEIYDEPYMTAGPNTFVGQMVTLAGGVNIFNDVTEDYPQVSGEEIIQRNPDAIMSMDSHGEKILSTYLSGRPGWSEITAVQEDRVFVFPDDWVSRPGPRLIDGLEAIAVALYPDLFAQ